MEHDGELKLAFRRIAEARKQMEEAGEIGRLAGLHRALGIAGSTVLGSMIRTQSNAGRSQANGRKGE